MTVDEGTRGDLYTGLTEVLGAVRATTLMAYLPSVPSADLITRQDLGQAVDLMRAETRAGVAEVRQELAEQIGSVRAEMAERFGGVRSEMAEQFGGVRSEIGAIRGEIGRQTWRIIFGVGAIFLSVFGALVPLMVSLSG